MPSSSSVASIGGSGTAVLRRRGSVVSTEALLGSIGQGASSPTPAAADSASGSAHISAGHADIALPSVADFLSHIPAAALASGDERAFFEQLHAEWRRVDAFFVRELDFFAARGAQLRAQTAGLREEADWIAEHDNNHNSSTSSLLVENHEGNQSTAFKTSSTRIAATAKSHAQHTERLRAAVKDQYHGLSLLLNFRVLNHTALSKLLARHARASASQWSGAAAALMPVIERSNFYRSERLSELVYDCEVCDF